MVVPLAMGWRNLLFESYPVAPDVLAAHLPEGLAVDTHDGDGWLSVVPFTNVAVRPRGLPAALGQPLPELNLRTYVVPADGGDSGVYFFSLDAQGALAVAGARLFHHLPYFYARIALSPARDGRAVRFESRRRHPGDRPAHYAATYGPTGPPLDADPDSLAAFLTERYRFYTQAPDGTTRYTTVDHDPWTLHPAEATIDRNTLFAADGFARPESDPTLYYSPGVDVTAARSRRWGGA